MRARTAFLAVACLLLSIPGVFARDKTDVVILVDGNRIVGEIKEMKRGILRYSTDFAKTIDIEWPQIAGVISSYRFEVETIDGTHYYGAFQAGPERGTLVMALDSGGTASIELYRVVSVSPIEEGFWNSLDGSFSLGYNYTRSSGVSQFTFESKTNRRTKRFLTTVNASAYLTTQRNEDSTKKGDLSVSRWRFLRRKWFTGGFLNLQTNEELGIDLRSIAGGGMGRDLVQNNHTTLSLAGGLAYTYERFSTEDDEQGNLEAFLVTKYDVYRFNYPETDVGVSLIVYPSLTDSGRVRADADAHIRQEIVKDFFWSLSVYGNYDNRPPGEDAEEIDYGVVTSIGYSY